MTDATPGETRTHAFLDACARIGSAWADPFVDVAGILGITAIVYAGPSSGLAQLAVGGVTTIALGKRYLARPAGGKSA